MVNWQSVSIKCVCPFCSFFTYRPRTMIQHWGISHPDLPLHLRSEAREKLYRAAFDLSKVEPVPKDKSLRRLVRMGNSTVAVSLPKEWATKNGVYPGCSVRVTWDGNGTITVRKVDPCPT